MPFKPYARLKRPSPSRTKPGPGWTRLELVVALISVVVAAIGVLLSFVSTVLTYKQLLILNRERLTPYRAIVYNVKVESYRELTGEMVRWRADIQRPRGALAYFVNSFETPSLLNGPEGERRRWRRRWSRDLPAGAEASRRLEHALARNRVFWPQPIAERLLNLQSVSSRLRMCFEVAQQDLQQPSKDFLVRTCALQRVVDAWERIWRDWERVEEAMRQDLRADQLQGIRGD